MTFKSLFGLAHLLKDYGVDSRGLNVADKAEMLKLTPPFLAQAANGVFVIVTGIGDGRVTYDSLGEIQSVPYARFEDGMNGNVLVAFPDARSAEPGYASHRLTEVVARLSGYALAFAALAVFVYFFVTRGIYAHVSTVLLTVFDLVGLYFSFLLLQKSLNIRTRAGDRVWRPSERGLRLHHVNEGVKTVRRVQLERGGIRIFRNIADYLAGVSAHVVLACAV